MSGICGPLGSKPMRSAFAWTFSHSFKLLVRFDLLYKHLALYLVDWWLYLNIFCDLWQETILILFQSHIFFASWPYFSKNINHAGKSLSSFRRILLTNYGVGHFLQKVVSGCSKFHHFQITVSSVLSKSSCHIFNLRFWIIWFLLFLGEGDLFDAVVPFMGESITDGTLATFLKSMWLYLFLLLAPSINWDCYFLGLMSMIYVEQNLETGLKLMNQLPRLRLTRYISFIKMLNELFFLKKTLFHQDETIFKTFFN